MQVITKPSAKHSKTLATIIYPPSHTSFSPAIIYHSIEFSQIPGPVSLVMMDISIKSINPTPPFAKIFCRSVSSAFLHKASFFSPFLVSRLVHTHIFIDFFQFFFVFWNEIYSRFVSSVFLLRFQCHTLYRYFFVFLHDFLYFFMKSCQDLSHQHSCARQLFSAPFQYRASYRYFFVFLTEFVCISS